MFSKCARKNFFEVKSSLALRSTCSYRKDDVYQFLPKSEIPTMHFQASLPRLPIPKLQKTCEKYLRSQKPLTTTLEYAALQKLVKDFEIKEGPTLQKELKAIDAHNKHTSYISKPWFEMYLQDRKPLPINYNPFLVFIDDPKPEYNDQLIRATNLLISSLRFMKSLRNNTLEPEVYHLNPKKSDTKFFRSLTSKLPSSISWYGAYLLKAYPLDMSQYNHLFSTTRVPLREMDKLAHDSNAKHIMVMKNGNIYKMDVLDAAGNIYDPLTIYSSLKWILKDDKPATKYPVGILTTETRDMWADLRDYLENQGNAILFNDIDSSIFNLVFDMDEPTKEYKTLIKRYLHSDGISRWFDKSFSLIIGKNGVAGLNFEHSWGDGVAVLRYFTDVYKDSTSNPQVHPDNIVHCEANRSLIIPLEFIFDNYAKISILNAKEKYSKICESLDVEVFEFLNFGRNLCRKYEISPDSLMQLAFQIAYYKQFGKFVSTYESCSTAAFKHGRTETVRPCTVETKALAEALCLKSKSDLGKDALLKMLKDCSTVHGTLIKDAAMGQGFDRHLFALFLQAQKRGKVPRLFESPLHQTFNHFTLSTSTLSSDIVMLGAFGPVVEDGFGIGYSIWNDRLGSIVSYYKKKADGSGFIHCLEEALHDLYNILN